MTSVEDIVNIEGQKALAEFLGVPLQNITYAKRIGRFPAKHYVLIRDFCVQRGRGEPPMGLFTFADKAEAAE